MFGENIKFDSEVKLQLMMRIQKRVLINDDKNQNWLNFSLASKHISSSSQQAEILINLSAEMRDYEVAVACKGDNEFLKF